MSEVKQLYQNFRQQLTGLYNWRRSEHRRVLAWLMVAIFVGKDICLDRLGLYLPREAKPESVAQQFRRWLNNKAIEPRLVYDPVVTGILNKLRCRRLRVQLDRVRIKTRQNVLMLSVHYRKRAIPLAWICLEHRGHSTLRHWQELLDYLESRLKEDMQVIILADREFGSVARLQYVAQRGWAYAIRLKGNTAFYDPIWRQPVTWQELNAIALQPGQQAWWSRLLIYKKAFYPVSLAAAWARGCKEPWFIATNLPSGKQALREYARRFGCEELFSDLKKRGFNWEDSRIRRAEPFARLILALALLTVFLLSLGRRIRLRLLDLELGCPSHRRRLSLFQVARRWLRRRIALSRLPPWVFDRPFWLFTS